MSVNTAGGRKFDRRLFRPFEARTCFCGPAVSPSKMPLTWSRSYKETSTSEDDVKEWKLCCAYEIEYIPNLHAYRYREAAFAELYACRMKLS